MPTGRAGPVTSSANLPIITNYPSPWIIAKASSWSGLAFAFTCLPHWSFPGQSIVEAEDPEEGRQRKARGGTH